MYLSSIPVETGSDPNRPRPGRMWISNPYRVHQRISMAFDGKPDDRILFRIEGPIRTRRGLRPRVLVQSLAEPDWDAAFRNAPFLVVHEECAVKAYDPQFQACEQYRFLLRANPTVKKKADGRKHGIRLGIMREDEQVAWLERKAELGGFRLVGLPEIREKSMRSSRRSRQIDPQVHRHFAVTFSGLIEVYDSRLLYETIRKGIGSAKAYGFGLLSLART